MYLLFDIGGTNMRVALSDGNTIGRVIMNHTPRDYQSALKTFQKTAETLGARTIKKAIGGVPKFISNTDKLTFWHTNPAAQDLRKILKAPVSLVNDAEIAGIGESVFGAGKDHRINAYLTFSTGFGGSKVVDGEIDPNFFGYEPRMQIALFDTKSKKIQPLNPLVSGKGITLQYGKSPERIRSKKTWKEIENWMKIAVVNAAVFWSPQCVIIGGAVGLNGNISTSRIQKFVEQRLKGLPNMPTVKKAKFGQLSGLYGALALSAK